MALTASSRSASSITIAGALPPNSRHTLVMFFAAVAIIVDEIGLPRGVFNLVLGRGETVGQELAGNPKVAMVSMTGSVSAGEKIMATAAKNITKVCLELGGKAPAMVM
ncbi:aldehyde dehydrogenase family protein, partial [Escherichia coli]|uniref:aldehyde dehydrogenase family protein n=1 Tax=Escherichia coli TaxID=562 RepID=UPI003D81A900